MDGWSDTSNRSTCHSFPQRLMALHLEDALKPKLWFRVLLVVGMLVSGSINTLSKKAQNDTTTEGLHHDRHKFEHAWFQTLIMFIGEGFCLMRSSCNNDDDDDVFMKHYNPKKKALLHRKRRVHNRAIILMPTVLDLMGTTFGGIGLIYTYASVWQMLRGSIIIFTGLLSVLFLKRRMYAFNWIGIVCAIAGCAMVGAASLLGHEGSEQRNLVLGLIFIILGQFTGGCQMIVEEIYLKKLKIPPLEVVGWEGLFGTLITAIIVLPILYNVPDKGSFGKAFHDNSLDAIQMMTNSGALVGFVLLYLSSIAFYNFFGLSVTHYLTAVHRTLIDALRTIVVWTFQIVVHYAGAHNYGETWTKWSLLQLGGFLSLMTGTLIYNKIIRIPGFYYPPPPTTEPAAETADAQPLETPDNYSGGASNQDLKEPLIGNNGQEEEA